MRIHFLIICLLSFFASYSQDSLVCIKPSTARFFLEKADEADLRKKQNLSDSLLISDLNQKVRLKDKQIILFKHDSVVYNNQIETNFEDIRLRDKQLHNKTLIANSAIGATAGSIIGSVIPGVGTILGATIGAGTGLVISIFRNDKNRNHR